MQHKENSIKMELSKVKTLAFEECLDSAYVNPIHCNYPVSELSSVQMYEDVFLLRDAAKKKIYYVKGDSVESKLDSFGRGPGEYQSLTSYAYCEEENTLYVFSSVDQRIFLYDVPSFEYRTSFPFYYNIISMRCLEGKIIAICSTLNNKAVRSNGIYSIDVREGETKLLLPLDYFSVFFSDDLSFFEKGKDLYLITPGYDNTLFKVTSEGVERMCEFHYGKYNLKKDFFDVDETDSRQYSEKMLELYDMDYAIGGYCGNIRDGANYSFWCSFKHNGRIDCLKAKVDNSTPSSYRITIPIELFDISPDNTYGDWFVKIINNTDLESIDEISEMDGTIRLIAHALKKQEFDNPILLLYRIKDEWK